MNNNPLNRGILTANFVGVGLVSRELLHARTRELALIAGREIPHVTHADYAQAKRELTGESDPDRQDAMIEGFPESKRWDPVPGSEGRQVADSPSEDEDAEGRSETAQLVAAGVNEAEHDQMLQAAEETRHGNRPQE